MIDDVLLSLLWAAWTAASAMPLGFMLGAPCSPCCGCGVADGKPRTDPKDEGTWVPSGTWRGAGGVTWTFTANPGDDSGETWFFYGSVATSKIGGGASLAEQRDWGNICNWYSNKTTSPSSTGSITTVLNKRATRLPPDDAIVHVYTPVSTASVGPQTVKNIFFWGTAELVSGSEITSTDSAHDSMGGAVFNQNARNFAIVNGGATFNGSSANRDGSIVNDGATFNGSSNNSNLGTANGGATFNNNSINFGFVNGGATFNNSSQSRVESFAGSPGNTAIVNGGATFNDSSVNTNQAVVNDGATFNDSSQNADRAVINGGATFNDSSQNLPAAFFAGQFSVVNGGATFNDSSENIGIVNDGATFNGSSLNNGGIINDGATFNGSSENSFFGTVNGGATFNDAACTRFTTGDFFATPCTRKFVAHPADLPICNGTAPDGCQNFADTCGCG